MAAAGCLLVWCECSSLDCRHLLIRVKLADDAHGDVVGIQRLLLDSCLSDNRIPLCCFAQQLGGRRTRCLLVVRLIGGGSCLVEAASSFGRHAAAAAGYRA